MNSVLERKVKLGFDFVLAGILVILVSPVLLLLCLLVRIQIGTPVFFRQQRPGLKEKPFWIYKFRTMNDERDSRGEMLPDKKRLTKLGLFMRNTSIDELPELINVIKGDMSLVGPRPLLMQYLERYTPRQSRRHEIRPGITGWAQVNGRNAISWEEKFELDVWYVDNQSFWLDIKILWITLLKVLRREGINAAESETMPEFFGQSKE